MRSYVVDAPGRAGFVERPVPVPGAGEVLVRVEAVGICGSDVELVAGRRDPAFCRLPVVPGHEWCGSIEGLGSGVAAGLLGARVAVEGHCYCRVCAPCLMGATHRCVRYDEFGFTRDGAYASFVCARADLCHPMRRASAAVAAVTEPAACALHAIERVDVQPPDTVIVIGAGPIGLLACAHAAARGAASVVVADVRPGVVPFARAMGATDVVSVDAESMADALAAACPGGGDVVVEAAGRPETQRLAMSMVARGGRLALLGIAGQGRTTTMSLDPVVFGDVRVEGIFAYPSATFGRAARLLDEGRIDPRPLLTHHLPLSQVEHALALVRRGADGAVKVILDPQA